MRRTGRRKSTRPKKVTYEFIDRQSDVGRPIYALVSKLVDAHHEDLRDARIAIAWATAWRMDQDGFIVTVKITRASDLDREIAPYDLVMQINRDWYYRPSTTAHLQRVQLDKALQSVARRHDSNGEPAHDERLRPIYRSVKPDVQEYKVIIERYGIFSSDIERLELAMQRAKYGRLPGEWISARRLAAALHSIGLDVPVDEINGWPQDEREQIEQWVQVRREMADAPVAITNSVPEPTRITEWRASSHLPFDQTAEPAAEPVAH